MSGYTRTENAPSTGRDSTIPRFHTEAVENPISSTKAGRPIYDEEERVQIIMPGSPNSPVLHVTDEHRNRWPEHYKKFRDGQEFSVTGTPLEVWPFLRKSNVMELRGKNIHTVEQCAGLSDLQVQALGMGGLKIRENAKAYLSDADAMKIVSEALADKEAANSRIAHLEEQLAQLKPMMDQLYSENMAMKNAPSPVQSYVPGAHDPLAATAQNVPMPESGGSSLDRLPARRGRPPLNRDAAA